MPIHYRIAVPLVRCHHCACLWFKEEYNKLTILFLFGCCNWLSGFTMSMCNAIAFAQMAESLIFNFLLLLVLQDAIPSNIDLLFLQTMHLIAGFIHTHTHTTMQAEVPHSVLQQQKWWQQHFWMARDAHQVFVARILLRNLQLHCQKPVLSQCCERVSNFKAMWPFYCILVIQLTILLYFSYLTYSVCSTAFSSKGLSTSTSAKLKSSLMPSLFGGWIRDQEKRN